MERSPWFKIMGVRNAGHHLWTEYAVRRTERGKDVALGEDRAAHGQLHCGTTVVLQIAATAARRRQRLMVLGVIRRQN